MAKTIALSSKAAQANDLVETLQRHFVSKLEKIARSFDDPQTFIPKQWLRNGGRHGGGIRYCCADSKLFNRASVNVSQVHYDDDPSKSLGSATALSTIIHPQNPHAPSVHMHISWTELKNGKGYWRIMADLNPAIADAKATRLFSDCLEQVAPKQFELASAQGSRYFFIPALDRHRGVQHFYLEEFNSGDEQADLALARSVGEAVIQCYCDVLEQAIVDNPALTEEDFDKQLAYHTLYLFQVLTLDRGTTSGLLVHDQNDLGILGSLPARIDRSLLASWKDRLVPPQNLLLESILVQLPDQSPCLINDPCKQALSRAIREHYINHPEAIKMQASGNIDTTTIANHR